MGLTIRLAVDAQSELGECPVWCEITGALYWSDIDGACLHRWRLHDGQRDSWPMPQKLGSFALSDDGRTVLLGLASAIALYDLIERKVVAMRTVETHGPSMRINDGACDVQGRFVFGMFNESEEPIGPFWRVNRGLSLERLPLPAAAIGNSIAFSPDGSLMYFTDSVIRTIFRVPYAADGTLGAPEVFVKLPEGPGVPDGSAIDADGGLWNAQWGGSCVVRYAPTGQETDRIELSASQVTSVAFGGDQLEQIFITSAAKGLHPDLRARQRAGGVFAINSGRRGLFARRFALN